MTKRKTFYAKLIITLPVIFILAFSSCAVSVGNMFEEGPPLMSPVAARIGTEVVGRGPVIEKQVYFGIIRTMSYPLSFVRYNLHFGEFLVDLGEEVQEGQLLARLDIESYLYILEGLEQRLTRLNQRLAVESSVRAQTIDLMQMDLTGKLNSGSEAMNPNFIRETEQLRFDIEWAILYRNETLDTLQMEITETLSRIEEVRASITGTEILAPFDGTVTFLFPLHFLLVQPVLREINIIYISPVDAPLFLEYVGSNNLSLNLPHFVNIRAQYGDESFELEYIPLTFEQVNHYSRMWDWRWAGGNPIRFNFTQNAQGIPPLGSRLTLFFYLVHEENALRIPSQALTSATITGPHSVLRYTNGMRETVYVDVSFVGTTYAIIERGLEEGDVILVR